MQLRLPRSQLTVDELTSHIQGLFTSDATLKSIVVSGEIAEFKKHTSGHCYFTLLGEESRVACAIFKQYAGFIPKWPDNGDSVLVEGSVGIYPQRGVYQLYARRLVPVGAGAIERARREVKERLEKEGLFAPELKRAVPPYPRKVALVTSETGAAAWDVIRVAGRRYPACRILVVPAQVQGIEAPFEIERALSRIAAVPGLDCVLLVRGGGSREDLVPFDDERVVRLAGPLLGAMLLVPLSELLREFGTLRIVFYGAILIICVIGLPEGIFHYLSRKYNEMERWVKIE